VEEVAQGIGVLGSGDAFQVTQEYPCAGLCRVQDQSRLGPSGMWIDRLRERKPIHEIIVDMDSSVSETYGKQVGSAYNGHFRCTCYHPLFCFNPFGDLEQAMLRNGPVRSADDWHSVLGPVVARYRDKDIQGFFRADAAFARPEVYEFLEAEAYRYSIRLLGNDVLERAIEHLLTRPVGRPPNQPLVFYDSFPYQAAR